MGRGSYRASDWTALRKSKGLNEAADVNRVFTQSGALRQFSCADIKVRESRDSADSPCATPVIIGFDVTASMGYLAKELAVHALNQTVTGLLNQRPIEYPHVLCAAVGDSKCDSAPLQATQFEADIRIIEQLTQLWLEGGGGGNGGESYHLLWYFAANRTRTDCFEKRGKKGYLFTIGDDRCHLLLTPAEIRRTFGSGEPYALSNEELLREAERKYHVFHIGIAAEDSFDNPVFRSWQKLMPGRCTEIGRRDVGCLAQLITAIIAVTEGKTVNEALSGTDQAAAEKIARSMAMIDAKPAAKSNRISF